MSDIVTRKATVRDAAGIAALVQHYASRKFLLPRTREKVCEAIRDFFVCDEGGAIVACGALQLWSDLAEIRSLAVWESHWRRGLGSVIVGQCLEEAQELGVSEVFALTYQPEFFERLGFTRVSKERFPQKIWTVCANCAHFPNCTEVALIYTFEG